MSLFYPCESLEGDFCGAVVLKKNRDFTTGSLSLVNGKVIYSYSLPKLDLRVVRGEQYKTHWMPIDLLNLSYKTHFVKTWTFP
jgi:hypothetical protein